MLNEVILLHDIDLWIRYSSMLKKGTSFAGERLEFVGQGQVNLKVLEEEFEEKRALYQSNLQPFYRQCKKIEVIFLYFLHIRICIIYTNIYM